MKGAGLEGVDGLADALDDVEIGFVLIGPGGDGFGVFGEWGEFAEGGAGGVGGSEDDGDDSGSPLFVA